MATQPFHLVVYRYLKLNKAQIKLISSPSPEFTLLKDFLKIQTDGNVFLTGVQIKSLEVILDSSFTLISKN